LSSLALGFLRRQLWACRPMAGGLGCKTNTCFLASISSHVEGPSALMGSVIAKETLFWLSVLCFGLCCFSALSSLVLCYPEGFCVWSGARAKEKLGHFDQEHYARELMRNVWASSSWQRGLTRYKCLRGQASISTCRGLLLAALLLVAFVSFGCRALEIAKVARAAVCQPC
jgi:hypothetical protein